MKKFVSLFLTAVMLAASIPFSALPVFAEDTAPTKSAEWHELNDGIVWEPVEKVTEDGYYIILCEQPNSKKTQHEYAFLRALDLVDVNEEQYSLTRPSADMTELPEGTAECPDLTSVWKISVKNNNKYTMYSPSRHQYLSQFDDTGSVFGVIYDDVPYDWYITFENGAAKISLPELMNNCIWPSAYEEALQLRFYKAVFKAKMSAVTGDFDLSETANTADAARILFGGNEYRVIGGGNSGVTVADRPDKAYTLFAEKSIGTSVFGNKIIYADSELKPLIDSLVSNGKEADAVLPRTLAVSKYQSGKPYCDGIAGTAVENAYFWPLSSTEAAQYNGDLNQDKENPFWLRSPGSGTSKAAYYWGDKVFQQGRLTGAYVLGVRPAFNLDSEKVLLYTSADMDGSAVSKVDAYNGSYKLTLKHKDYAGFKVTDVQPEGSHLKVSYTGAVTGENNRISILVRNFMGVAIWYGAVGTPTASAGSVTFALPELRSDDTLYVFEEEQNGENQTNFASDFYETEVPSPAVMLGADVLKQNINTTECAAVYFEAFDPETQKSNPIRFRVVGYGSDEQHIGVDSIGRGANDYTLFTESELFRSRYRDDSDIGSAPLYRFSDSTLYRKLCRYVPQGTVTEAITPRTITGVPYDVSEAKIGLCIHESTIFNDTSLTDQTMWAPNPYEWVQLYGDIRNYCCQDEDVAYNCFLYGNLMGKALGTAGCNAIPNQYPNVIRNIFYQLCVTLLQVDTISFRAAFNLSGDKVVLTTAATAGKPANIGSTLPAVGANNTGEWKLTIADTAHKGFAVSNMTKSGSTVTFNYTGAQVGENERISVVAADENGYPVRYGQIAAVETASGSASFEMPGGDGLKYYVINEQVNGDKLSDFSSPLIEIEPTSSAAGSVLSEGNIWIIIAVAAVVIIAGAVALIMVKKKRKPALAGCDEKQDEE